MPHLKEELLILAKRFSELLFIKIQCMCDVLSTMVSYVIICIIKMINSLQVSRNGKD